MLQEKRKRFIKISRSLLENMTFDSVEEFRALFYLKVESDVFSGDNERFKSKVFMQEFLLFVFKRKNKVSKKKFEKIIAGLKEKGVTKDSLSVEDDGFIILHDYEVERVKGVKQVYAMLISKWAKGNSNVYFKKEVFYKWFDCDPSDRAKVFQRAMNGIGLDNANYKIEGNRLTIFRNISPVIQVEEKYEPTNPMMKEMMDLCDANLQKILREQNLALYGEDFY